MKKFIVFIISIAFTQIHAQKIELVKNINPSGNANISYLTEFNGKLYFSANDGVNGQELWVSDGTEEGTIMLKDINPSGSSNPKQLAVCNGKLYFQASLDGGPLPHLWISDGTEDSTFDISNNCHSPQYFTAMNGKVYFSAIDNDYGTEFWASDGTKEGTKMVKNILTVGINEGVSSEPSCFTVFNDTLYFVAKSTPVYFQIFQSDGTEEGTIPFEKFPNLGQSTTMDFIVSNGKMFFNAAENDSDIGFYLYVYDGINPVEKLAVNGNDYSNPSSFFEYNNKVVFNASSTTYGNELWISDGTMQGTRLIKDINIGLADSWPLGYAVLNNKLYFSATDTISNSELWVTDGTEAGTKKVKEINTGNSNINGSSPKGFTVFNNKLYFTAKPLMMQVYLFESEGTANKTLQIDTALLASCPPSHNPDVSYLFTLNENLFFLANYTQSTKMLYKLYIPEDENIAQFRKDIQIHLYPNPATNSIKINSHHHFIDFIEIYDVNGKNIYRKEINDYDASINVSDLNTGIYSIKIYSGKAYTSQLFVKE